ncbi:MAG: hypothetical protein K2X47_03560 [Bdellovibrionales bacterium]|nr:hypothetical protein [Bdellovibrionales bacterium]
MEKIIDAVLTAVSVALIAAGGHYSIKEVMNWSQRQAFRKASDGLGNLESATKKMTGGKLDF